MKHFQSNFSCAENKSDVLTKMCIHIKYDIKSTFSNEIIMKYNMTITDLKIC